MTKKKSTTALISDLKRKTRRRYSSEEKIRIIIEGLRGEMTTFRCISYNFINISSNCTANII